MITRGFEKGDMLVRGFYARVVVPVPPPPPRFGGAGGAGGPWIHRDWFKEEEQEYVDDPYDPDLEEEVDEEKVFEEELDKEIAKLKRPKQPPIDREAWFDAVAQEIGNGIVARTLPPAQVIDRVIGYLGHPDDPTSRFNWLKHRGVPAAFVAYSMLQFLWYARKKTRE